MLCGLLQPTSGDAMVAGFSIKKDPDEVKKRLGYMSQKFSLYPLLTVRENIEFYAGIYGLTDAVIKARIPEVCTQVELEKLEDKITGDMPGGLKQRVALACAIAHKPAIVFLDEPTAGVDPILRRRFWEIIGALSDNGTTVFVTTHYMDEVEHCNRISLMHSGRIIKEGTIPEIKKAAFEKPILEIQTDTPVKAYDALNKVKEFNGDVSIHGALIHLITGMETAGAKALMEKALAAGGVEFTHPEEVEPTMDDVFVKLVKNYEAK
jgi:ABC-2 type transport system ATP-binding protein